MLASTARTSSSIGEDLGSAMPSTTVVATVTFFGTTSTPWLS